MKNGQTAKQDLANIHALHQRIMNAFPDRHQHPNSVSARQEYQVLFRIESHRTLLVQSAIPGAWQCLPRGYAERVDVTTVKIPSAPEEWNGQSFRFRILANPAYRDSRSRKIRMIEGSENQIAWLKERGRNSGFLCENIFQSIALPAIVGFKKTGSSTHRISVSPTLYEGTLRVADGCLFTDAVRNGIGRAKVYGCGLLSLA